MSVELLKKPLLSQQQKIPNYGSNQPGPAFFEAQRLKQIQGLQSQISTLKIPDLEKRIKDRVFCIQQDSSALLDFDNNHWAKAKVSQEHLAYIKLDGVKVGDPFTYEILRSMVDGQRSELAKLKAIPGQIRDLNIQLASLQTAKF